MSDNARLVRKMVECYNSMNADGLREVLAADCRYSCPGSDFGAHKQGADTIIEYFKNQVFPAFDQVRFEIKQLYQDPAQNSIVVEWDSHLQPKTGHNYSNKGVFVIDCTGGANFLGPRVFRYPKISRKRELKYTDRAGSKRRTLHAGSTRQSCTYYWRGARTWAAHGRGSSQGRHAYRRD